MTIARRVAAVLLLAATSARAQVVRGTVRDASNGTPIPGVIVALDEAVERLDTDAALRRASLAYAALTNDKGEFAVRAAAVGRYVLSAKRVGLKRYQSAPFQLAIGETRRMDVSLSPIDMAVALSQVDVVTDAPCTVKPNESRQVAALWEEARAALTATRLALRDRLFRATIVRYVRELQPQGLRVIRDQTATRRGVIERAFASIAASELSAKGYAHVDAEGAITYFAPDAAVLTSDEFLRDHCFAVSRGRGRDSGLLGLSFEPVPARALPEIQGTMWMDSARFELRRVDFRYLRLPGGVMDAEARGEVRFTNLDNGWWYVSRWFIRMPQFGPPRPSANLLIDNRASVLLRYREEGGDVTAEGAANVARSATVVGRMMDSTGRTPLRGGRVRLAGTPHTSGVAADGSFRLDSLAAGAYTLIAEHPVYARLGLLVGEQDLEIGEATSSVTALQAPGTESIMDQLCGTRVFEPDRAMVRVIALSDSGAPLAARWIRLRYDSFDVGPLQRIQVFPNTREVEADREGGATFCDTPARIPLRFELLEPDRTRVESFKALTVPASSIVLVDLRP
jgi:hypothetical protein